MSLYQFTNNANTTLGSAISSGATTITVATGTGILFPTLGTGQYFTATLFAAGSSTGTPNEIVRVTARTGDTMTVLRGQEGTTAQSWNVGDSFSNFITAGLLNNLVGLNDVQSQFGNSAVDAGSTNAGVVTLSPAITSLASILYSPIRVLKINTANTGAYTLNVNGLGAKSVLSNGAALLNNQLAASTVYEVSWNGTNFDLLSSLAVLGTNSVSNSILSQMASQTVKANLTGSTANASDATLAALATALGFGSYSLGTTGYYSFPAGFTVQWGAATVASGSSTTPQVFSFPIAFTTAYRIVDSWSQPKSGATSGNSTTAQIISKSQYGLTCDDGSGPRTVNWIAVGVI